MRLIALISRGVFLLSTLCGICSIHADSLQFNDGRIIDNVLVTLRGQEYHAQFSDGHVEQFQKAQLSLFKRSPVTWMNAPGKIIRAFPGPTHFDVTDDFRPLLTGIHGLHHWAVSGYKFYYDGRMLVDDIGEHVWGNVVGPEVTETQFSKDHYAFAYGSKSKPGSWYLLIDGLTYGPYPKILNWKFGGDLPRTVLILEETEKRNFIQFNGKRFGPFTSQPRWSVSPDHRNLVYEERVENSDFLVNADGTRTGPIRNLQSFTVGNGLNQIAYFTGDEKQQTLIVSGESSGLFESAKGLMWPSGHKRPLFYHGRVQDKANVEGKDQSAPGKIIGILPVPNTVRVAMEIDRDRNHYLSIDGTLLPHPIVDFGNLVFSPDGQNFAFSAILPSGTDGGSKFALCRNGKLLSTPMSITPESSYGRAFPFFDLTEDGKLLYLDLSEEGKVTIRESEHP